MVQQNARKSKLPKPEFLNGAMILGDDTLKSWPKSGL